MKEKNNRALGGHLVGATALFKLKQLKIIHKVELNARVICL